MFRTLVLYLLSLSYTELFSACDDACYIPQFFSYAQSFRIF